MFTAFHSQTDGQTQWVNHVIEDMLQHNVYLVQDNWNESLAMVEFVYNDSSQKSKIQNTPFVYEVDQ